MTRLPRASLLALVAALAPVCGMAQSGSYCVNDIRGTQVCATRAGQCLLDRFNVAWCAPGNGTAMKDRYGDVVCGAGACVMDVRTGENSCASKDGGFASLETGGKAICDGGCVPASKAACRRVPAN